MDGLESTVLYEEPFALAVPDSHRLAARKHVGIDDLRDETLLLLEDGHCLRDQALEVCSPSTCTKRRITARPASRPCGRWSRPVTA